MRSALLVLVFPFVVTVAEAQTLRLDFSSEASAQTEPGQVIARRVAMRAWQDSVEVYAAEAIRSETGWRVVTGNVSASYLASIVAVPVAKPGYSGVAMSVVIFEPGTLVPWKYISHFVSVVDAAPEAALSLVRTSIRLIRARR